MKFLLRLRHLSCLFISFLGLNLTIQIMSHFEHLFSPAHICSFSLPVICFRHSVIHYLSFSHFLLFSFSSQSFLLLFCHMRLLHLLSSPLLLFMLHSLIFFFKFLEIHLLLMSLLFPDFLFSTSLLSLFLNLRI